VPTPETVAGGDITDLPPGAGGRSLAVVLALGARAVVGGAMAPPRRAARVLQALAMATSQRPPAAGRSRQPDRGRQDGADRSRQCLTPHGIQPRRSRQGHGWDNAVAERCFPPVKTALLSLEALDTHEQAQTAVCAYMEVC
jgi:putative transposase